MWWRVTLAVAVVCVGSVYNCVEADLMSSLIIPRDYGVKLCGREFIRAVIFTCGGSRWRRSTEGDSDPLQWSSLSDVKVKDNQQTWRASVRPAYNLSAFLSGSSYYRAALLALYRQQQSLREPASPQPSTVWGEREENQAASDRMITPAKVKRNFSLGVAGKCCNQGCTKNDIGRLC